MNHIIMCGLGPHARKYHYNILESLQGKYDITIELLIDLESRRDIINRYLANKKLKPKKILFLKDKKNNIEGTSLDDEAVSQMTQLYNEGKANKMLVSTEPKAHKIYAIWALQHNIDVLIDKPLTAPIMDLKNLEDTKQLLDDFDEIKKSEINSKGKLYVVLPKRNQLEFKTLHDLAEEIVLSYELPITYIGCSLYEGMWNMPDEFFTRENHPYKYGYGGLLHSGYHYTDFVTWMLECNDAIDIFKIDKLCISSMSTGPYDFVHQVNNKFYQKYMNENYSDYMAKSEELKSMGELDTVTAIQAKHGDATITNISLNLLHTSYSGRAWTVLPEDTYSKNGRLNNQDYILQFGNLACINAYTRRIPVDQNNNFGATDAPNGEFIIDVYRDADVIGGKKFRKIVFPSDAVDNTQNIRGRQLDIEAWLKKAPSACDFDSHKKNIALLQKLYACRVLANLGKAPYQEMILS